MASLMDMVKELRERTGAGMADCKKALTENNNDIEKAIDFLREKGLAQAAKKAGRIAAEGLCCVAVSDDGKTGAVVEVNCETDFAAVDVCGNETGCGFCKPFETPDVDVFAD